MWMLRVINNVNVLYYEYNISSFLKVLQYFLEKKKQRIKMWDSKKTATT